MNPRFSLPAAAALVAFAVYLSTIGSSTVIDDDFLLVVVLSPKQLLFEPGPPADEPYYRPVTVSTYAMLHVFPDGAARERAAHIGNLFLHAGATLAVFWLCVNLLGRARYAWAGALLASLLFALHPIHSESVAWITARPDIIVALLVAGALYAYQRYRTSGRWPWLAVSALLALASPLAKEVGVAVFVLLPAFEWLHVSRLVPARQEVPAPVQSKSRRRRKHRQRSRPRLARDARVHAAAVFVAAGAVYITLRLVAFHGFGYSGMKLSELQPWRLLGALGFYAEKLFAPHHLVAYYAVVPTDPARVLWGSLAVTVGVIGVVLAFRARRYAPAFGIVWMALTLLPSMPLFVSGTSIAPIAERYLYLPSMGLAICFAWVVVETLERLAPAAADRGGPRALRLPSRRIALAMPVLAVAVLFAFLTVTRLPDWKDLQTYWETSVRDNPSAGLPHAGLGSLYSKTGRIDEAKEQYMLAVAGEMKPEDRALAWSDLGAIYEKEGDYRAAVDAYQQGAEIFPTSATIRFNFALAHWREASKTEPKDQALLAAAYEQAQLAVQQEPSDPELLFLLGMIAVDVGDYGAAKDAYDRIVALDPTSAWAEQARRQLALLESLGLGGSGSPSASEPPTR